MPTIAQIHDVLQTIYGERLQLTGETAASLAAAEARLGVALPTMLRDYYRLAAHGDWPNCCHNRLVALMAGDKVRGRASGDEADDLPFFYAGFAQAADTAKPGTNSLFV